MPDGGQTGSFGEYIEQQGRKRQNMEAKKFGQFIAGIRKEKKMTQAELAGKIHVTDKAISRWERGLGFPDIQTLEPLAQALGISVLELMRSERQETEKQDQQPEEFRYTQGEVAEMLQNAGDISRQQKKQDRDANVIAGIVLAAITIIVWMTKLASFGGALVVGGIAATVFVSLWYFFQNIDDAESRKIYGVAAILSVGFLLALMQYVWGEQLGKLLPGEIDTQQEIFWTVWYLFVIAMLMMGTFRAIRQQRQKKVKRYKTVLFSLIMGVLLCATLWQYQGTIQRQKGDSGVWSSAQQYAETLLKNEKQLENDWLVGDESWKEKKNVYHIRLTYYADAEAAKEGQESEYEYVIRFDARDGFVIKSQGVPEKEMDLSGE
jgi:transcriptional regulator with XRE-family HTH domain